MQLGAGETQIGCMRLHCLETDADVLVDRHTEQSRTGGHVFAFDGASEGFVFHLLFYARDLHVGDGAGRRR